MWPEQHVEWTDCFECFECFSWLLEKKFQNHGKDLHQACQIRNLRNHKFFKRKVERTKNAFYVSRGTFRGKNMAETKTFWPLGKEQEKAGFKAKTFIGVVNTAFRVSRETLWDKRFFFEKKTKTWHCLLVLKEEISDFWQKFSTRVTKPELSWPEEHFEKVFLEEDTTLYHFMVFPRKFWLARELQVPQNGFLRVQRNISRKKLWLKPKQFELWVMSKKKTVSWRNSFGSVVNFAFHVSRETLWDKRFFIRKNL